MNDKELIKVEETDRDRFARTTKAVINGKTIVTPCFAPRLTKSPHYDGLELFMRLRNTQPTDYLGVYVIRLFDLWKTIDPRLHRLNQTRLDRSFMEETFLKFRKKNVFLSDPSLEYLFYEARSKQLASTPYLPMSLLEFFEKSEQKKEEMTSQDYKNWRRAFHSKFWYTLDKNRRARNQMVGELLDLQMEKEVDFALSPVPFATNESLFDIAISINRVSREIVRANYESADKCATYFLMPTWIFTRKDSIKEYILKKLVEYIKQVPAKLTILKFKYLNIGQNRIVEREEMKKLLRIIAKIREAQPERLFMLLEAGVYASPMAALGFDIVSTSLTSHDGDGGFSAEKRGQWFDLKEMVPRSIKDVWTMYKNGDDNLPCYCSACKNMSRKMKELSSYKDLDEDEWNLFRREHYCLLMNEIMRQTDQAIEDRQIELYSEKLVNSELALLKDLIPRNFDREGFGF